MKQLARYRQVTPSHLFAWAITCCARFTKTWFTTVLGIALCKLVPAVAKDIWGDGTLSHFFATLRAIVAGIRKCC